MRRARSATATSCMSAARVHRCTSAAAASAATCLRHLTPTTAAAAATAAAFVTHVLRRSLPRRKRLPRQLHVSQRRCDIIAAPHTAAAATTLELITTFIVATASAITDSGSGALGPRRQRRWRRRARLKWRWRSRRLRPLQHMRVAALRRHVLAPLLPLPLLPALRLRQRSLTRRRL